MTYEELIEEAGAAIGIEGFAPDADGICMLVSDIVSACSSPTSGRS